VTDRHGLVLPDDLSPGEYTIVAGMYRHSGERLTVNVEGAAAGDSVSLGQITVVP